MESLKLRDSLTNKVVEIAIDPKREFKMYLCGPTVYDHVHIGNMRPSVVFDLIRRVLTECGLQINYVQNLTDIDDKIIERAHRENKSEELITSEYTTSYLANFKSLNLLTPHFHSVTTNIDDVMKFIERMIKNGSGYRRGENVLFDIEHHKSNYGKLSKQIITKLSRESGRTIDLVAKKDQKDFVLWKKASEGLRWNLGSLEGRPGWHTECATLIDKFFKGTTIDIHGGGKDLLFPHHENERIQYWAVNNKELSKTWIHFGHVNFQGAKMSKSLANQIPANHFITKYGAQTLKLLLLNSNYNEDINVSNELIKQAEAQVKKITNVLKKISFFLVVQQKNVDDYSNQSSTILTLLLNNLDTVKVFFILEECITFINKYVEDHEQAQRLELETKISQLLFILKVTGLDFQVKSYNQADFQLIKQWQQFLLMKNFQKADEVRAFLQSKELL